MNESNPDDVTLRFRSEPESLSDAPRDVHPERIGRYRIERLLGSGGFGDVYLALDTELHREVAIKVPHRHRVSTPSDIQQYLEEARAVAALDHPNIVPIYDVGSDDQFPCFAVAKYVQGVELESALTTHRFTHAETAKLISKIAAALHHGHRLGIVHRDVKPRNILLDEANEPFIVDFGLALREVKIGQGPHYVGTPSYMSPEQARGEGHRVDGRSDVFSLGVVLYRMLAGRNPFQAESVTKILALVSEHLPRPLRQTDETIPEVLARICEKAMSKRATDRYTTAWDFACDLDAFLSSHAEVADTQTVSKTGSTEPQPASISSMASQVVPKGLRSFDASDAGFFLELLPGPRDYSGLPDSVRFWKSRIESTDVTDAFPVGLLYGVSGCGKSSFVRAALIPRLGSHVRVIYVQASDSDTEASLVQRLKGELPTRATTLVDSIAEVRKGEMLASGQKLLIVIDQLEQWLNAHRESANSTLVQALRQCDGVHVQCLLLVRDDFWMPATRLMRELEIRLVEGHNSAAADLFDMAHAEKVLANFGRAFNRFDGKRQLENDAFIHEAVRQLAEDGRVICVRLALFAEIMKNKPWTLATLREMGGTTGVGLAFLQETFNARNAPPMHRLHESGARAVLQSLLPEFGTNIKGHMRSYSALAEASGYMNRREEFDELLAILDQELRLVTPTDLQGTNEGGRMKDEPGKPDDSSVILPPSSLRYYQLTHDYLVHSLRDWLTLGKKQTRRGRAELLLQDRAGTWNARPENRLLPSLSEVLTIRVFAGDSVRSDSQIHMMRKAGRFHGIRAMAMLSVLAIGTMIVLSFRHSFQAQRRSERASALVETLRQVEPSQVREIVAALEPLSDLAEPMIRKESEAAAPGTDEELNYAMASVMLVDSDSASAGIRSLETRLMDVSPESFSLVLDVIQRELDPAELWGRANDASIENAIRFRSLCVLARIDPENENWNSLAKFAVHELLAVLPSNLQPWREALRPVKSRLLPSLDEAFHDRSLGQQPRVFATETLMDYVDETEALFEFLVTSDDLQFDAMYAGLAGRATEFVRLCERELGQTNYTSDREAERKANAAVALFRLHQPKTVLAWFAASPDQAARTFIIHRLVSMNCDTAPIVEWIREADRTRSQGRTDDASTSTYLGLLFCLGSFPGDAVVPADRTALLHLLRARYESDPDAGLHSATEWVLHRLETDLSAASDAKAKAPAGAEWFLTLEGQTMIRMAPATFLMGSPDDEPGRSPESERQHLRRINRTFALSSAEVTLAQFNRFLAENKRDPNLNYWREDRWAPTDACPAIILTWYEAAGYCNWLSQKEGIDPSQWCYTTNEDGIYTTGMRTRPNHLLLSGYRLPTEAEWEYACRAGTLTAYCFGNNPELVTKYAWIKQNADNLCHPVGLLLPNDWGFFDMYGNVTEWCSDEFSQYPEDGSGPFIDSSSGEEELIAGAVSRSLRGGDFDVDPRTVRSATRINFPPTYRATGIGFRPARTLESSSQPE